MRGSVGLAEGELLALESETFGKVVAAAQTDDAVTESAQEFPAFVFAGSLAQAVGGEGIAGGYEGGQMVGDDAVAGLGRFPGLSHETAGFGQGGLLFQ